MAGAKSKRIEIRVSAEEHAAEEAAAQTLGVTLSEFYRQAARASAAEVLAERSRVVLSEQEAANFLDALDHPERFKDGMAKLARRPAPP